MTTYYDLYFPETLKVKPLCFKAELEYLKGQLDDLFLLFKTKITEPKKDGALHYAHAFKDLLRQHDERSLSMAYHQQNYALRGLAAQRDLLPRASGMEAMAAGNGMGPVSQVLEQAFRECGKW